MATRVPLANDEWYHCYNRGTDKRTVFENPHDYERFIALLYVSNGSKPIRLSDKYSFNFRSVFEDSSMDRGAPLVEIAAYSLMPTHVHLVLKQVVDSGVSRFMQKVFTAYTMYFNLKRGRTGSLFSGTFKSKHIGDDRYLKQVIPYVLLNPVELFEKHWKEGVGDTGKIEKYLRGYPHASLPDLYNTTRPQRKVLGTSIYEYYDSIPSLESMLRDAQAYYRNAPPEV